MPWFVNDALKACYWVSEPFWVVEVHRPRKPAVPAGFTEVAMEAELALEPGVPAELQTIRQPGVKGAWKLNRKGKRAFWQDNNQRRHTSPTLVAKRPIYPPWGYRQVDPDSDEVRRNGPWTELGETAPGRCDLRWAVSNRLWHVPGSGPTPDQFLAVGEQLRTRWGTKARITAITPFVITLAKVISDRNDGVEGIEKWAGRINKDQWAYVKPRKAAGHQGDQPVRSLDDITLGFMKVGVSGPAIAQTPLVFGPDQTPDYRDINGLKRFSRAVGGNYYAQWGDANPENPSNPMRGTLIEKIKAAMGGATRIHFNLDGFFPPSGDRSKFDEAMTAVEQGRMAPWTYQELTAVLQTPALLNKTTFYRNGTSIPTNEVKVLLGRFYR